MGRPEGQFCVNCIWKAFLWKRLVKHESIKWKSAIVACHSGPFHFNLNVFKVRDCCSAGWKLQDLGAKVGTWERERQSKDCFNLWALCMFSTVLFYQCMSNLPLSTSVFLWRAWTNLHWNTITLPHQLFLESEKEGKSGFKNNIQPEPSLKCLNIWFWNWNGWAHFYNIKTGKKKKRNTEQTREERDMNKYVYMITIDVFSV